MTPELYNMTQEQFDAYIEECNKSEMETFHPEEFERKYGEKSRYYQQKERVYTYYENINFKHQSELLDLWSESWRSNGFDPIVLSLEDAKKSPYYDEFVDQIQFLVLEITGRPLSQYGMSCYLRWLAYSAQADSVSFLVSDYDVINRRFTPVQLIEPRDKIAFMDRWCPCLAYGTKEQFLAFCKEIIASTREHIDEIKANYIAQKDRCYHDQNFLDLNQKRLSNFNICPARKYIMPYVHGDPKMQDCSLIHFSHGSIEKAKAISPELKHINSDELRVRLIKEC
jgi:hypothetical protein